MPLRNLAHQREPEPHPFTSLARTRQAVKGLEDAFTLGFGHARAPIRDAHPRSSRYALHSDLDRVPATRVVAGVAACVLEQVAQQPAQQARVTRDRHGFALDLRAVLGRFLRSEGEQVHRLGMRKPIERIQTAREQQLTDQAIQLGDVLGEPVLQLGALVSGEQLQRHAHARERGAQLVRHVREQSLVPADQLTDALGRTVEAAGELGHFVAALDLDTRLQVAGTQRLHPHLQALEASCDPPGQRICPQRHGSGQRHQREQQAATAVSAVELHQQPAPIWEVQCHARSAAPALPAARALAGGSGLGGSMARRRQRARCHRPLAA